ncbi:ParB N-terminal domain-containing protein [Halopelagius longus]|uniref:ParB-like N-terminal domain-containing protein n=1 Tax=Halopelagius longus TaxID=1236180 RepID=A0A1H1GVA2_9EURY|nr:hypothetical protein [Halopelagius longus]SDR17145.1 hypothetical protein SAMN05216278_3891 [Halopelagius longus]
MDYQNLEGGFEQEFKGKRVRVYSEEKEITGWAYEWYDESLLIYKMTDEDDEHEVVLIQNFDVIEVVEETVTVREVSIERLSRPSYDVRVYDSSDFHKKLREVNLRGHLNNIPFVREISRDTYEVVSGSQHVEIAKDLRFSEIPVRILQIDEWEAVRRFVYEHVPLPKERNTNRGQYYSDEEINALFESLQDEWPLSKVAELYPLKPEIEACRSM